MRTLNKFYQGILALYDEWFQTYPFIRKRSSTRNRISSAKHLLVIWANTPITKVTKQMYRQYLNSLISKYKYNKQLTYDEFLECKESQNL
jgi:hypothetical protein